MLCKNSYLGVLCELINSFQVFQLESQLEFVLWIGRDSQSLWLEALKENKGDSVKKKVEFALINQLLIITEYNSLLKIFF